MSSRNIQDQTGLILPLGRQVKAWRKANRKMGCGIRDREFKNLPEPRLITEEDREQGYLGLILFYGFGDDGRGNSDPVLSGKLAWEYVREKQWRKTWQCEIDAVQMFCSRQTLGLGIGNVDRNYPGFSIPALKLT